ncbi:MAG: CotH protein, partial [Verrucomicrobiales bacterium]|nr:CotH protein [Verrucomicrobiales bacterium]
MTHLGCTSTLMKLKYLGFQSQWLAFFFVVTGIIASGPAHGQTSNGVLREVYLNIGGNAITDLTGAPSYPNSPSFESIEPIFEAPANVAEAYGQRMRALILPPQTGTYFFWISSDDNGALYLSTDENPATRVQIATVNSWTSSREWTKEPNQKSAGINLTAGQRYYIEALQKEGGGGDNLAVRWQLPNATIEEPIPNNRLLVYGLGPPQITQQPANITLTEGGSGTFSVFLSHMTGAAFQWFRNGTNVPGATNNSITVGPVTLADTTNRFLCFIANAYGTTNSSEGVLTVVPDTTPPAVSTVGNVGDLQSVFIVFSEAVDPATATNIANYSINNNIFVLRAAFGPDPRTIILTTTPIPSNTTNILVINNVRDRASTPNTIAANTQRTFSISARPIDISYLSLPHEPLGPTSRRHGVVISEVMYHPTNRLDAKSLEFIEIYNTQPWYEELGGWRISGAIDFVFPSNTVLQGNSFLVVAANPTDFRSIYSFTNVYGPFLGSNSLQNSSGALRLRNNRDAVLFEMNYTGDPPYPVAADGTGHSLVLGRPSYGEGDPRAWVASEQLGGNPGTNDVPLASAYSTVVINEFLAHTDLPQVDYIELYNYGNTAVNIGGCAISDDPATNKYVIPLNTILQPRGFALFTENTLGYRLSAGGETILFRQPNGKVVDIVKFGSQENGVATGRYPDGAALFTRLNQTTPGTNNAPFRVADVVINEVMYDPVSGDSQDEYVELYNRATNAVNIGGWRIRDAVSYNIPSGTIIGPNGYLVIAANAARLRSNYANLTFGNTLGNFSGSLANGGERIELNMPDEVAATNSFGQLVTNKIHIMMDEVTYGSGGRWGNYAGGGGSSLELIDARSDHRLAPNWADSDESAKSQWFNVETTGVMDNGYADANQLHITLMGAGECLIDNVEVIPAGSTNLIGNSTFESGTAGWVFQGNHNDTTLETAEGYQSARSLHLRATGRGDTGANRLRVQLPFTLAGGTTVTLRAKVRWLKGNPNILLRLRGNWLEAPGNALTVKNLGTPGQANSRAAANVGPAITGVRHDPPLPAASQPVLVVAQVDDPDGISLLTLNYRVDPSTNYSSLAMTNNGAGLYSTLLPGQAAGVTVGFYVAAMDNYAVPAGTSFPNDAPTRECVVRWGDTAIPGTLPTYRFWVTQTNVTRWSTEEKMSNKPKDVTFIYGNSRIVYNAGAWFHGSPYHSPGYDSPVGAGCDYDMVFPKDEMLLGETDINLFRPGNGGGDGTSQAEIQAYWFGGQFGLPFLYCRPVFVYVNGQRRETAYYDAQQPNGDFVRQWYPDDPNGELHKIQIGFEFGDTAYGNGEAGFGGVGADLNRYTTTGGAFKQARYRQTWPLRSVSPFEQNDYTNLFALVNSVLTTASIGSDAYTAALTNITEVEEWFKVHVVQHMINNGDSFSYGGGQNAFAYKPERSPWKLLLWDVDFAFGGDPNDGNIFSIGGAEHGPRNDHPAFRRIYFQTLIEAANGFMTAARSNPILEARYNGMVAAGAGVGSPSGIESFIATRRNVVLTQIAANQSTFRITSNGGADFSTNRNLITITGTAPLEVKTILVNGIAYPLSWTSLSNWVVRLPLSSGNNVLLITGLDPKGNPVPSVNGTIRVTYTGANELPQDKIVINEIMYNPYFADASFIEIYNTSVSNAFDMSGWMLRGAGYTFPPGVIIEPGMYLLLAKNKASFIAAYGNSALVLDEFPGTLDTDGETLTLVKPGATPAQDVIIDQVTYEKNPPWPADANGTGSSLQLIDVTQDNNRVSNWGAVPTNAAAPPVEWKYVTVTGTASSTLLYVYLQSAGDVYVDDIKMVSGSTPEVGVNSVQNGDFETAFPGPWTVSANHAASVTSTSIKHSGNASLHVIASSGGTTQGSAIWQTLSPALVTGQTYTLSFWYLQSTNGGPLTLRLSGSGIQANLNIAPPGVANSVRVTPGFANSIRATVAPYPTLWLNEVLPNNFFLGTNGIADRFGDRDPWVELFNGGTNALSLDGYYLANNYTNVAQWAFPTGITIPAKQFLTVWLDGEPSESTNTELHTSFRIASDVGSVVLSRGTNMASILDYLNYNIPTPGRSYGSYPDGAVSGRRLFGAVTPNGTNNPAFPGATVRINEWMADNTSTLADPADGKFDDWIELYNYGTNAVDLTGYYLSDTLTNATDSLIPAGTTIPARGFLLVWADNTPAQNSPTNQDIHGKFSLSKTGEAIALFGPDGQLVDAVTFGPQTNDVTQGRFPDGATPIYFTTTPTPRGPNIVPEQNFAPVVNAIGDKNINEGSLLSVTVVASDPNGASQTLTYSIDGFPPSGSSINPNTGLFRWSPS